MNNNIFDKFCILILVTVTIAALMLMYNNYDKSKKSSQLNSKSIERELAYLGKINFLKQLYGPVEILVKEGKHQFALIKLDELIKKYPTEAFGYILQGEILVALGLEDEAINAFVKGVKLNGDYLDSKNPLSRRIEIQNIVDNGLRNNAKLLAVNPDNHTLTSSRRNLNYLKSRLAGGCE